MISFLIDLWWAFRAGLRAARQDRQLRGMEQASRRRRAIAQAARLALMSPEELQLCARSWGGAACQRELERRDERVVRLRRRSDPPPAA